MRGKNFESFDCKIIEFEVEKRGFLHLPKKGQQTLNLLRTLRFFAHY